MDQKICYLCGNELNSEMDKDHVPPKQFYSTEIRRKYSPNLFTLPVHKSCNFSYQLDEDYFLSSIAPLAGDSFSGEYIWQDIVSKSKRPESKKLILKVYYEFQPNLSSLIMPKGKIIKRFDGKRIFNIVWKITRGLYFKENNKFLPENTPRNFEFLSVGQKPPVKFNYILNSESKGDYPGVFDYKYVEFKEINNFNVWAMLFWNRIIIFVMFHSPGCNCKVCIDSRT